MDYYRSRNSLSILPFYSPTYENRIYVGGKSYTPSVVGARIIVGVRYFKRNLPHADV